LPYELYGGVEELFERLARERPEMLRAPGLDDEGNRWTWGEYSSAVVVSIVGFSMWPHLFMKAFSARSDNTLRRTVLLYPTFQVFSIPLFIIGFCGVFFESEPPRPDQILPHMLMNMELPGIAVGLFCAGALAASMSSGDAMAHAAGSIAVRDGWLVSRGRTLEPHRERRWIQAVIVAVMLLSYGMSLLAIFYEISLVTLLLSAYGAVVQFAPAVALALYARWPSARGVLLGMIAGAPVTILFTLVPALRPWPLHAGVYGLAVNCVLVVVWSRIRPPPRDSQVDRFLEIAATPESRSEPF
jgi:SSS family solute:Na+ symporter